MVHSKTSQELNFDLSKFGDEFIANASLNEGTFRYKGWDISGTMGFKIIATIVKEPLDPKPAIKQEHQAKVAATAILLIMIGTGCALTEGAACSLYAVI